MLGSSRTRRALAWLLVCSACPSGLAVAVPINAPSRVMARRGVNLTIGATTDDSTHVTVIDAGTGEILQQRWYVLPQAGPPVALETVRPKRSGRVTLEVQIAGQAPARVDVRLFPDWVPVVVLLVMLGVLRALRRARRAQHRPATANASAPGSRS
jgi:hypothetical protein